MSKITGGVFQSLDKVMRSDKPHSTRPAAENLFESAAKRLNPTGMRVFGEP
jgi:hypothetical protein